MDKKTIKKNPLRFMNSEPVLMGRPGGPEAHTLRHVKRSPLLNAHAHLPKHLLHLTPIAG